MNALPSISNQIDEDKIFQIIEKNFSKLAPIWYSLITNWLVRSYNVFQDIDKFIILIYFINKNLIFYRKNGLIIDYDAFYEDKELEIQKINISDVAHDLKMPKESVRRKILELENKGVIKKTGKKIFLNRSAFITAKAKDTLKDLCTLIQKLNVLLVKEKVTNKEFEINEISNSIKENFSFCWYQFYKFLFIFTNRWKTNYNDLETFAIGLVVMLNTVHNKDFLSKDLSGKSFHKLAQGSDDVGVNAMSISDITGIPRPTVVRKLKYLIKSDFLNRNEKKLLSLNIKGKTMKETSKLREMNMKDLSNFLYRVFNQIKIINS
jgi:Mn-dependent DtxR family transcriptional regulator